MYHIGKLAKLADVTTDTIRFYEKQGLMERPNRTECDDRLYSKKDLQLLRFIRYAKQLGFTLESISELLSIRIDPAHHTCQESKNIVDACLQEIEIKIIEMERMRNSLKMLSAACCGSKHVSTGCSILEILEQGASKH
ncbi:zinc-responsive transcriptional regulator [Arsenophonus endosymbiont of Bemisia tabaci Asia II 3]|nr:zinc-responsive transcriptional regulator [Arsenophonus endosymbiont of Bemisia tabaci Asia II 3]